MSIAEKTIRNEYVSPILYRGIVRIKYSTVARMGLGAAESSDGRP